MAIVTTVLGIVKVVKPEHPSKEDPPIVTKPSFNVTDVRPVQSSNAELPIIFTLEGMIRDEILRH